MNCLFFELLRIAIGTQERLSHLPSGNEWDELFEMAKRQSLVGICFTALQQLGAKSDNGLSTIGMSEGTYLTWMGVAAKISVQNEMVNLQCAKVQKVLGKDGLECCILKGQGVASFYGELSAFRQSGDIDVWVWPKDGSLRTHTDKARYILEYMSKKAEVNHPTYHNASWKLFSDTEVEIHYTPSWMYSPIANKQLQDWFEKIKRSKDQEFKELNGIKMPSVEFNMVYILQHIYRHLFGEGIGLRQVMDYYFVLKARRVSSSKVQEVARTIERLGLKRFTAGMMWIMQEVFDLEKEYLLMEPYEKEGRFLLNEIMLAGNFGKYDERINRGEKGLWRGFAIHVKRNLHFIGHYPIEVLWCPLWKVWHQLWLKKLTYNLL